MLSSDTGRWITFHCLGMIPLLKHSCNNLANGLASSGAACFKTLAGIQSGPFAFLMSSFCRILIFFRQNTIMFRNVVVFLCTGGLAFHLMLLGFLSNRFVDLGVGQLFQIVKDVTNITSLVYKHVILVSTFCDVFLIYDRYNFN